MKDSTAHRKQAELFQALAHPGRLRILDVLACHEACVCHLTAILGKPQPYVSQHLAILRDAGLVTDRREGTLIFYRLADERLGDLLAKSRAVAARSAGGSVVFPSVPEALEGCPCPRCRAS